MKMQDDRRSEQLSNLIKNDYFFFSGRNLTFGSAHPTTGNYDVYGKTYRFKTKDEATDFYNSFGYEEIQIIGKASKMRKFHLGTSVENFHEFLNDLDYEVPAG